MKKIVVILLLLAPATAFCQLLDKLKRKVKDKTEEKVVQKVDKSMDKGFDKAEQAAKPGDKTPATTPAPKDQPATTPTTKPVAQAETPAAVKSYSRFDFIPGEQIVYTENFEQDAIGELPTSWNTTGKGEVVTLDKFPGKWLQLFQKSFYLTSNEKEFGENYTLEFDVIMQLKNTGYYYPYLSFNFISTNGEPATGNDFLRNYRKYGSIEAVFYPADAGRSKMDVRTFKANREYYNADEQTVGNLSDYFGKPIHIAVQVQKERLRIWAAEQKIFDAPKAVALGAIMNQLSFEVHVSSYKEEEYGMYISNLKVAKGVPDTRHKLVDEGKFSTTGILFDVNSDVIRPESFGVLKDIAGVLKDNADIKIKIIGHTDNDGEDQKNLELSKKRSASVAKALQENFSIDAARLQTDGKGETVPVGDNKTKEGKALNRRVEFIKL
jgi:OOP family OmpA-OmpF porin